MSEQKPGYKTTEFWLSLLVGLWGAIAPGVPATYQVTIPASAGGVYALARGLAKAGVVRGSFGEYLRDK